MRGNAVKSLQVLNLNPEHFQVPNLEELYVSVTLANKDDSYNVAFFFDGQVDRLTQLKVLWVEAKDHPLYVEEETKDSSTQSLAYTSLTLKNIRFVGHAGEHLLERLHVCQELTVHNCKFGAFSETNLLLSMKALHSLTIKGSPEFFEELCVDESLGQSLKTLKLEHIESNQVFSLISRMKSLTSLVLADIDLASQEFDGDRLFNPALSKLSMARCKLQDETAHVTNKKHAVMKEESKAKSEVPFFEYLKQGTNSIVDLCILGIKQATSIAVGSLRMLKVKRLCIDDTFPLSQSEEDATLKLFEMFPNMSKFYFYRKSIVPSKDKKTNSVNNLTKLPIRLKAKGRKVKKVVLIADKPDRYDKHDYERIASGGLYEFKFKISSIEKITGLSPY
mmetsp:Transcript_33731/g.38841  ORF Transcript_33731/g.38841 Transcript_33731/m.38841 type:complete len:392 (-) Transcript_33731:20-1195(-)